MRIHQRVFALLLALVLVVGVLPVAASAADDFPVVKNGATITVKAGQSYEAFAEQVPIRALQCPNCGRTTYMNYPGGQEDYLNASITTPNDGVISNLCFGWEQRMIDGDPEPVYAPTMKFVGAKAGTTTITVSYSVHFTIPYFSGYEYACYCGQPIVFGGYDKTERFTYTFNVTVEDVETTYTLSYNANGGVGGPGVQTDTNNTGSATFTVPNTVPTREGYEFKGWAETADATAGVYLAGDTITLHKDAPSKTLYAVWEEIPAPVYTYTLNYNANEGTGAPNAQTETSTEATYDFTVSDVVPTREGYTFLGWADAAEATAAVYAAGAVIHMTKENNEKTIYAVWEKNAEPGPGEKVSAPGIVKEEDKTTLNGNEVVNYTLTSNVPDYLGDYLALPTPSEPVIVNAAGEVVRGSYPLSFYDKLPEGLTFNEGSLSVTIGTTVLPTTAYTLTMGTATDDFTFRVDMDLVKLYEQGYITMADIENAEKIYVKYSATLAKDATPGHYVNSAWVGFEGGFSEKVNANLNTYGIEVFKYDQSNSKAPLAGATFQLKDAAGNVVGTATTDANGKVRFNALAAGTYTLEELEAPKGYVKSEKTLTITLPDNVKEDLVAYTEFANAPIPHTGGEGTSMFFILGGTLMGVAVALYLASQKKRSFQA